MGTLPGEGGIRDVGELPERYAYLPAFAYLRYCERFSVEPWGGPDRWNGPQEALVREFLVVREQEEARG